MERSLPTGSSLRSQTFNFSAARSRFAWPRASPLQSHRGRPTRAPVLFCFPFAMTSVESLACRRSERPRFTSGCGETANQPISLTLPPQGHWCNIEAPTRRRPCSGTADRWAVASKNGMTDDTISVKGRMAELFPLDNPAGRQGDSDPRHRPKRCTMLVDNHAMECLCEVMSERTNRLAYVGRSPAKSDQHGSEASPVATARRFGHPSGSLKRIAMRKTTTFSTILVLVALLAAHMAWAGPTEDGDREAARIATKQATAAYNLGHYDEAASLYEEAYRRVPDPILLYDLGQSYRQADRLDKALTAYRSYLRTAPDDAPNRAKVQQWVGELEWTSDLQNKTAALKAAQEKRRAAQVVTKPAEPDKPAEPRRAVEAEPVRPAGPATPPESQIQDQQAPPPPVSTRSDLVTQAPAVEEFHSSPNWKKWAPWVGVGITAALGVATLVEGLSANSSFNDLQGNCGKTRTCTDSQVDGVRSKTTVTNVLLGLTAASAAATGVVFYFSYSGSKETAASLAWRY